MVFEAESQLDKQQKAEHGGVLRSTDAAKVQVGNCIGFEHVKKAEHAPLTHP